MSSKIRKFFSMPDGSQTDMSWDEFKNRWKQAGLKGIDQIKQNIQNLVQSYKDNLDPVAANERKQQESFERARQKQASMVISSDNRTRQQKLDDQKQTWLVEDELARQRNKETTNQIMAPLTGPLYAGVHLVSPEGITKSIGQVKAAVQNGGGKYIEGAAKSIAGDVLDATIVAGPTISFALTPARQARQINYVDLFQQNPVRTYGKIKYYGPTMGKTTAAKSSSSLIDFDDIVREEIKQLAKSKGVSPRDLKIASDPDYVQLINDAAIKWNLNPANDGKTLMISNKVLSNPGKVNFTYDNTPSVPSRDVFITRQVGRGAGTEAEATDYYNVLLKENPNLQIDDRFVSQIEGVPRHLPGYQLKGFMRGNPLEKQLSKEGTISLNSLKAYAAKQNEVTQDIINQVLAEDFAGQTKINYDQLRQAIQKRLIKYNIIVDDRWETHGLDRLDFHVPNHNLRTNDQIYAEFNARSSYPGFKDKFIKDTSSPTGYRYRETSQPVYFDDMKEYILSIDKPSVKPTTFTLSSSDIPKGSDKHYDYGTLGHIRTYTTPENPEILHILESQSDWGQHKFNTGFAYNRALNGNTNVQFDPISAKYYFTREGEGIPASKFADYSLGKEMPYEQAKLQWDRRFGVQAKYLHDNYEQRQLQEALKYAAEQKQTKLRYPTPETAAKIEGYRKTEYLPNIEDQKELESLKSQLSDIRYWESKYPEIKELTKKFDLKYKGVSGEELEGLGESFQEEVLNNIQKLPEYQERSKAIDNWYMQRKIIDFIPEHKTILKKYANFPKMFEKLYGKGTVRTVTDIKGNTWYEVDVPKDFLDMEWQYKSGGKLNYLNFFK